MQTARRLVKGPDTAKTSKKQFAHGVTFHVQCNIPKGLLLEQEQLSIILSSYLQNLNHRIIQEEFLLIKEITFHPVSYGVIVVS